MKVTDSASNTATAVITINSALSIAPVTKTVVVNAATSFTATGGVAPYSYSRTSGNGVITTGGSYTAPASSGTDVVRVTDSLNNVSSATITINPALIISPSSVSLAIGNGFTFSASGGIPPLTFSANGGTINSSSGYYVAPGISSSATVTVTDSISETSHSSVTVNAALSISPTTLSTISGNSSIFIAAGGVAPYTFSVIGTGSITANSSVATYVAGSTGTDTVKVLDSLGNSSSATATIRKPISLATSDSVTCALISGGTVECWGYNGSGGLGNGTYNNSSTPVIVGGVSNAIAITVGSAHGCALISGGTVKCWGQNLEGQLGNNATISSPNAVNVTGISTAIAIAAGDQHTCALLSSGAVQCWGQSLYGELGNGTSGTRSLVPVNVSNISTATAIAAGQRYTVCAVLLSGGIQCWGYNVDGELGNGTTVNSSIPVSVSGITTAIAVNIGAAHLCATLSGGTVRCWGSNSYGELGFVTGTSPFISKVPATPLIAGIDSATSIALGYEYTCMTSSGGAMQCWGYGIDGELGNNSTTSSSSAVSVSGISSAVAASGGEYYACVLLSSGIVECWGQNLEGQLGNGTTTGSTIPVQVGPWQ